MRQAGRYMAEYRAMRARHTFLELCKNSDAAAPLTVPSYVVEGGASRDYVHVKRLMYEARHAWARLMDVLVDATARYLNGQIAAGADAVQVFDSWVGALAPADYRAFVLPH